MWLRGERHPPELTFRHARMLFDRPGLIRYRLD